MAETEAKEIVELAKKWKRYLTVSNLGPVAKELFDAVERYEAKETARIGDCACKKDRP